MRQESLTLRGVGRSYPAGDAEVHALRDVSLSIGAGEMIAIMGPSGSGKSTLMNILGCLDRPTAGTYAVFGQDVRTLDNDALARLRREYFGFIFQRYHLMPHLTAAGNVEVPAVYAGTDHRDARARQLLARLGMEDRTEHRPSQLSGGQQQRVSIARALMNGGRVILADEPTGALDSHSGQEVMSILHELHEQGHTIILVTHDPRVAAHAERIIEIADGEIIADRRAAPASTDVPRPATAAAAASTAASQLLDANRFGSRLRPEWARFQEAFRMAWRSMMAHRMRTALTMLGVIIGITSVVSIVAVGEGAKRFVLSEIRSIGTNTLDVYRGKDFADDRAFGIRSLVPTDLDVLAQQPYVFSVTPVTAQTMRVRYQNVGVAATINGVSDAFFRVRAVRMAVGTALSADNVRGQEQVVVIDENMRRKLFGKRGDALGKIVLVGSVPCTVIGVTAQKKSIFSDNRTLNLWLPYTTASTYLFGQQFFDSLTIRIRENLSSKAAEDSVVRLLTLLHGTKDFYIVNMDTLMKTVARTSQSLTLLLSVIAVISLIVGGIGVMNIMLVSVSERTHEIGIRMAVGARQSDVLQQFLTEAVLVCLVGGITGVLLSYGIGFVFALFVNQWHMVFSVTAVLAAVSCSSLIGVVFGYLPARNAARLDPIEALARE